MKPFKILSHTADLRLQIFGHDYEELFQNAVLALSSILTKERKKKYVPTGFEKVKIDAPDTNTLLVSFLNEILTQSQINRKVYDRIKFLKFSEKSLEAQIFGQPVENFDEDVKAVTYHNVEIEQNRRGHFEVELVLDI